MSNKDCSMITSTGCRNTISSIHTNTAWPPEKTLAAAYLVVNENITSFALSHAGFMAELKGARTPRIELSIQGII